MLNDLEQQHTALVEAGLIDMDFEDWLSTVLDYITSNYNWL